MITWVYIIRENCQPFRIKIGKSADPLSRLRELQTAHPSQLQLVHAAPFRGETQAAFIEKNLHQELRGFHQPGGREWFSHRALKHLNKKAMHGDTHPACAMFFDRKLKGAHNEVTAQLLQSKKFTHSMRDARLGCAMSGGERMWRSSARPAPESGSAGVERKHGTTLTGGES